MTSVHATRSRVGAWIATGLVAAAGLPAAAEEAPKSALLLYAYGRLLPAHVEFQAGFRKSLDETGSSPIELFEEFLDLQKFDRPEYLGAMEHFLVEKYASDRPDVIVAVGASALQFLVDRRGSVFPDIPIVYAAVERLELGLVSQIPADALGVVNDSDFEGTIEQALLFHPKARRLVIVTGSSPRDRLFEHHLGREARAFEDRLVVERLAGLPTRAVLARLGELGSDAIVFTPGYFEDGDSRSFLPRDSIERITGAATAPVYSIYSSFLGTGIVGGRIIPFDSIGREAGREVGELLRGATPASIRIPESLPSQLFLDWRQVRRWKIDPDRIPADAVVHHRPPGLLEQHLGKAIVALLVIAVQAALIGLLLAERRRRRAAEGARQRLRNELAHASRLAIAGELVGSIAHEINQPLGAILANADTAELILESDADRRSELRAILADIRRDDLRASEVIRRLRALLAKREIEKRRFDLNEAALEVERLLRGEARRRGVALEVRPAGSPVKIDGDRIQMQQVLINLLLNAMDALAATPEGRRTVVASIAREAAGVVLTVRDRGSGIAADDLPRLFDSFFTTKSQGMGLGLPIARTIVEAHDGRIRAENAPGGGATFHVELPLADISGSFVPEHG